MSKVHASCIILNRVLNTKKYHCCKQCFVRNKSRVHRKYLTILEGGSRGDPGMFEHFWLDIIL